MTLPKKEIQIMILVGGLGTRLKPITETIPKPMIEICGKPFLEYKLNQLKNFGIKNIILCVGYLGGKIEDYFGNGKNFGLNIEYSYEKELLGTAGAIKNAESLIKSDSFIVMNGDTYFCINLKDLFLKHNQSNYPMTMVVTRASNPTEQEIVEMRDNLIANFHKRDTHEHKEHLIKNPNPLVNAGVYVLGREILNFIPPRIKVSFEQDIFPNLIGKIGIFEYNGYMKDIANIKFCKEFERDIIRGII